MKKRQGLRVKHVDPGSPAEVHGVQQGDYLISINRKPIHDLIDFQFYSADVPLYFLFQRNHTTYGFQLSGDVERDLGIEFERMQFQCCGNHCVFCFIDQNPKGLRSSLYFKDEDYRLSFLFGNYVTLTRVDRAALDRIVAQRLTPMYVSIHAVNPKVRQKMFGLKKEDHLIDKIKFLTEHGIEIHGQIVLCPGLNDRDILNETLETLSSFYPQLRSVAVVPVGLTKHRHRLPKIIGYDAESAQKVLRQIRPYQIGFRKQFDEFFVYLADEFYLLSHEPLPDEQHYGGLWQVQNGVGQTRYFLSEFERSLDALPDKITSFNRFVIVTGVLAAPVLEKCVIPRLRQIKNCEIDLMAVSNRFFGESVTVSGLLTGKDMLNDLKHVEGEATILLPENCINEEGIFLDDLSPRDLSEALSRPVRVIGNFQEMFLS